MIEIVSYSSSIHGSHGLRRLRGQEVLVGIAGIAGVVDADHRHGAQVQRLHQRLELVVDQQGPGAGVAQDVADLVAAEPRVHRHEHQAGRRNPEVRLQHGRRVRQDRGHPVEVPQAQPAQPRGQPVHPFLELAVRVPPLPVHDRRLAPETRTRCAAGTTPASAPCDTAEFPSRPAALASTPDAMSFLREQDSPGIISPSRPAAGGRPLANPAILARMSRSAADQVLAALRAQRSALAAHEAGARRGADPGELRQMRAAVRRLRATLRAAPTLFGTELAPMTRELHWLSARAGRHPRPRRVP